ncbi:methylmalonyl Co-A mutase-associated GTPase MeaB [uncultured Zhongshania sp.]|uniref:methylmalonyl Co-A mutase-associated GTPase MeaB n=1 Tax=uncultured Zhongshania sp. TaxID=1642288 RepID=UPI0030DB087D|tara:strand:- start:9805 stop:10794 length:990 start_codon:yes stop_codon:yes gene_type:complete
MTAIADNINDLSRQILAGNIGAGARAIRWLDDGDPRGADVLSLIFPHTGRAHLIGITGPPGAGKSSLTNTLITEQRRRGRRVGVIAIDPSSPFTGGAILGDRVRMAQHTVDPDVFIRSIGTRGQAGGLSRSSHDACLVLDAMNYDVIFVETVGVGQDEIDVVALAHTTLIIGVPGLGDEVQAVKAGLMEAGDIFVINKADRDGYDDTYRQFELMLHLRAESVSRNEIDKKASAWSPPLLRSVAKRAEGTVEIVDATDAHREYLQNSGHFVKRSSHREREQFICLLREAVVDEIMEGMDEGILNRILHREIDPYTAASHELARWKGNTTS